MRELDTSNVSSIILQTHDHEDLTIDQIAGTRFALVFSAGAAILQLSAVFVQLRMGLP